MIDELAEKTYHSVEVGIQVAPLIVHPVSHREHSLTRPLESAQ